GLRGGLGPARGMVPGRKRPRAGAEPIRGELLSTERLEQFAEVLAAQHSVLPGLRRGKLLLPRLNENGRVLLASYRAIASAIREERTISPAAEWLADNFHIVEDQIREIRDDLPPGFYRELPKLVGGRLGDVPRVYGIAWTYVEHTDSRIDMETLRRFVAAYQTLQPLTIGELWALAISLRLVLAENLRRLAESIVAHRAQRERADAMAEAIRATEEAGTRETDGLRRALRGPLPTSFVVQLLLRLRDHDPEKTP